MCDNPAWDTTFKTNKDDFIIPTINYDAPGTYAYNDNDKKTYINPTSIAWAGLDIDRTTAKTGTYNL